MFNFNPTTGLLDVNSFPSDPSSETEARQQFMTLFNQIKKYLNDSVDPNIKWEGDISNKWIKSPKGLIIQWGTIQGSQLSGAVQWETSKIYNVGFNVDLAKPLSKIIGGDAICSGGTGERWRIWKSTVTMSNSSQSLATFNMLGLGNIFSSQTYDWYILGHQ